MKATPLFLFQGLQLSTLALSLFVRYMATGTLEITSCACRTFVGKPFQMARLKSVLTHLVMCIKSLLGLNSLSLICWLTILNSVSVFLISAFVPHCFFKVACVTDSLGRQRYLPQDRKRFNFMIRVMKIMSASKIIPRLGKFTRITLSKIGISSTVIHNFT